MSQEDNAQSDAPKPPPQRGPNDLPEAHDKTTEQIHAMSDFSVSEKLGVPLLAKDIKTSGARPSGQTTGSDSTARAAGWRDSYFGNFTSQDRLFFGMTALMILGPLFFGAMRG